MIPPMVIEDTMKTKTFHKNIIIEPIVVFCYIYYLFNIWISWNAFNYNLEKNKVALEQVINFYML